MITRRQTLVGGAATALALSTGKVRADTVGVTDTSIKIGHIGPYSGPASAYGQIGKAIAAYFNKINAEGGINGRTIDFISYDDGYSPPKAVEQARKLVESDEVALIFQSLGTPSNSAIHKYMNAKKVPQLFVATGATKWGDPENYPWTMGWQPNYQTECAIYGKYIVATHPDAKIGVLYQNDDYGKDCLEGLKHGLGDKTSQIIAEAPYEVADPTMDSQIIALKASGADVFVNIATPKFAAQAIKKVHEIGWDPVIRIVNNVSASVGAVMKPAGLDAAQGYVTAAYQMDPTDPQFHEHEEYLAWRDFMNEWHSDGDQASSFPAYGYSAAHTLEQVLRQAGDDLSRENIMKEAANLKQFRAPMLLPGVTITTSPDDFFPVETMQLQKFEGETYALFGEPISNESS